MKLTVAVFTIASFFLSSCATIVSSRNICTTIDSSPSKMAYKVIDEKGVVVSQGVTPSTATLDRSVGYFKPGKYTIEISNKKKVVAKETISASLNGWYFGNLLIGGLIGMVIVDPLSGAMYHMPEKITVNATTAAVAVGGQSQTLQIVDISTLSSQQRSKLVRI